MTIPQTHTLKGQLVILRTPKPADYPALKEILNHKTTMAALQSHFKIAEWTDELVQKRYDKFADEQKQALGLSYVVVEKENGQIVGNCGFKNINTQGQA